MSSSSCASSCHTSETASGSPGASSEHASSSDDCSSGSASCASVSPGYGRVGYNHPKYVNNLGKKIAFIPINEVSIKRSNLAFEKQFLSSYQIKKIINNRKLELSERFEAQLKLNKLPKNSAKIRIRNRCEVSGRPHGVYRKLKISRIALRDMASSGKIPGITKSSW